MHRPHYPADLRERVLAALDAGLPTAEVSRTFGISPRSLRRWRQWQRERGSLATQPRSGRPRKLGAAGEAALREQLMARPDATLVQQAAHLARTQGLAVSPATLSRTLARLGVTRKKRP